MRWWSRRRFIFGMRRSADVCALQGVQMAAGVGTGWGIFTRILARNLHRVWWHLMGCGRRWEGVAVGAGERGGDGMGVFGLVLFVFLGLVWAACVVCRREA